MKIVMFGTGPFAVPTFQSLLDSPHEVLALFTRPIDDAGKRRKSAANPTRDVAEAAGLPIFDPPDVNEAGVVAQLQAMHADVFVVCDFGQILSRDCLAAAAKGGINLHGSLLPKYRGAAPINWCLYHGDQVTGVTIIHMTPRLDGGPCLTRAEFPIDATEDAESIEPKLAQLGVAPVHEALAMLSTWDGVSVLGQKQDPALATKAPRLKKSDGKLEFSRTAQQLVNQVRAFKPWPGSFTHWHASDRKQPVRMIVHAASLVECESDAGEIGTVVASNENQLWIRCGEGCLSLDQVQPAGKKTMPIDVFLRGNQPQLGDRFD